jgi:hypothetical protein
MPNGRKPLCDMTGIDQEIKDLVTDLNQKRQSGTANGVNWVNGNVKTEDQDVPEGLPGLGNGAKGTTVWGVGALHHVISWTFASLTVRDSDFDSYIFDVFQFNELRPLHQSNLPRRMTNRFHNLSPDDRPRKLTGTTLAQPQLQLLLGILS